MGQKIEIAKSAGFCFGVKKAVDRVYELVKAGEKIAVLGELIHNRTVTDDLEQKGVVTIEDAVKCPKDSVLVIRTHGVGRDTVLEAERTAREVVDLTCPYVKAIHEIVDRESARGRQVVIAGDKSHPEVLGICGWAHGSAHVVGSVEDAVRLRLSGVCLVAQTTMNRSVFEKIAEAVCTYCEDVEVHDTICASTKKRQTEADELSHRCDVMFVIGGKSSSNTKKLYEICRGNCAQTYLIENFEEIPQDINYKNKKIGITAGASTPQGSIEEVANTMEEIKQNAEVSFEEAMEQTLKTLNTGDVVEGTVVEVRPTEVIVDLGFKSDGIIPASELTDDPDVKPSDIVKPGDVISVFVVGVNDGEGKTLLSKKKLDAIAGFKKLEEALENKTVVSGKVISVVKGGIIVSVEGSRVFVPARQCSDRYTEDLSVFMNQTVNLRITEINNRRKRVVGSIRSVLVEQKEALAKAFWESAEVGKKYTGVVKSIMPFGAFVDIGGVDGLVHISELSWNRIKSPAEVVSVGDSIEVYIKDINEETKKISLGFKKAEDNPWVIAQNKFHVGDVVSCKVVRFMPFGAFVELIPGVDGLIHISQIALKRVEKVEDELKIGQIVEAKITEVNWEAKRISLSMKALLEQPAEKKDDEPAEEKPPVEEFVPVDIEAYAKESLEKEAEEIPAAGQEAVQAADEEAAEPDKEEAPAEETTEE